MPNQLELFFFFVLADVKGEEVNPLVEATRWGCDVDSFDFSPHAHRESEREKDPAG